MQCAADPPLGALVRETSFVALLAIPTQVFAMAALLVYPATGVVKSFLTEIQRINAGEMRGGFEDG